MSDFQPGQRVMLDRSLTVRFVKDVPGSPDAIVDTGDATRVVPQVALSDLEA